MSGYFGKKLIDILGIKKGQTIYFKDAPEEYLKYLGPLPDGVFAAKKLNRPVDFMHCFYTNAADLRDDMIKFQQYLEIGGMLWISWPKKVAKVKADISAQTLRDILLPLNLVDIKVAAITDEWYGIMFLWRNK